MPDTWAEAFETPWVVMWAIGVSVFFFVKFATAVLVGPWTVPRLAAYSFCTPSLNPRPFLRTPGSAEVAADRDWWTGVVGMLTGLVGWLLVVPAARLLDDWLAGMVAMAAGICFLHFGLFRIITAVCRAIGWDVRPIMGAPWRSESLAEFWGRHWNTAFRDSAHSLLVRPLRTRLSGLGLTLCVFLASGLIHEIVISLPAGGWGGPTVYFLIQAVGLIVGKSAAAKRYRIDEGWRGTVWTAAWVLLPVPLLFHRPFCVDIILPCYDAVTELIAPNALGLDLEGVVRTGGWVQLSILAASFATPLLLDWKASFETLPTLFRQMFWVYGVYIVAMIVALATASILWADELVGGTTLGTATMGFTTAFWSGRLFIALFEFDAEPFLTTRWHRFGYAILNLAFVTLAAVYTSASVALLTQ